MNKAANPHLNLDLCTPSLSEEVSLILLGDNKGLDENSSCVDRGKVDSLTTNNNSYCFVAFQYSPG